VPPRRFAPPWAVEETAACFIVRDNGGQKLAYVYYEQEPGRRSAAKLLTKDEARRIAVNVAKLPEIATKITWVESPGGSASLSDRRRLSKLARRSAMRRYKARESVIFYLAAFLALIMVAVFIVLL